MLGGLRRIPLTPAGWVWTAVTIAVAVALIAVSLWFITEPARARREAAVAKADATVAAGKAGWNATSPNTPSCWRAG